jgi:hypothetical protein
MNPGGPVLQIALSYRPPGWESIPGLLKNLTNTGSDNQIGSEAAMVSPDICGYQFKLVTGSYPRPIK